MQSKSLSPEALEWAKQETERLSDARSQASMEEFMTADEFRRKLQAAAWRDTQTYRGRRQRRETGQ
jgi:hypothetical protein